jgi:hypothetical protein
MSIFFVISLALPFPGYGSDGAYLGAERAAEAKRLFYHGFSFFRGDGGQPSSLTHFRQPTHLSVIPYA